MPIPDEDEFFESGLEHYPRAMALVDRYREQVRKRLTRVLGDFHPWSRFSPSKKIVESSSRTGGYSIYVFQRGSYTGKRCAIQLGIWWLDDTRTVAYAGVSEGPSELTKLGRSDVASGFVVRSHRWVCREVTAAELDTGLKEVLRELARVTGA